MSFRIPLSLFLASLFTLFALCSCVSLSRATKESRGTLLKQFTHPKTGLPRDVYLCPNHCNHQGTCTGGKCRCNSGWAGEDCSFELTPLSTNQPIIATIFPEDGWAYYRYTVSPGHRWKFSVEQTENSGDCDLYVLHNEFPTDYDYDYYDISVDPSFSIEQPSDDTRSGNWFAGVNAWDADCSYTITASLLDSCDGNCFPHGTCRDGVCHCSSGWVGSECDYPVHSLSTDGTATQGSVDEDEWAYYVVSPHNHGDLITITVEENSDNQYEDAIDLFMEYGQPPTDDSFSLSNLTSASTTTLQVMAFNSTQLYFGVKGWSGGRFSISATSQHGSHDECEDTTKCSLHGQCNHGGSLKCHCNAGFAGPDCEIMTHSMTMAQPVHGYVDDGSYNLYYFSTSFEDAVVVSVDQIGSMGDCDVFIKNGTWPNATSYDYFDASTDSHFSITIDDPLVANWFVSVVGYEACEYNITYDIQDGCTSTECVHGTCDYGNCYCDDGYVGTACDVAAIPLTNNVPVNGSVSRREWKYYYLNMTDGASSLEVRMKELRDSTDGVLWLYLASWDAPDLMYFDDDDTSAQTHHEVSQNLEYNDYGGVLFYIGVYGSPFAPQDQEVNFELVAWHSDF